MSSFERYNCVTVYYNLKFKQKCIENYRNINTAATEKPNVILLFSC